MTDHGPAPGWQDLFSDPDTRWRLETARRVGVLIDVERYFEVFKETCRSARQSICVLGWDFDRRERLGRGEDAPTLEAFLCGLLEDNSQLQVHLLLWDYSFLYAREREWFQVQHLRHRTHPRLHVHHDSAHPPGGSQHQKLVIIDGALAFCGGIDLSRWRWDTCKHRANEPGRTDPDGKPYPPFHDLMMLVDGPAAAALADLAQRRFRDADADPLPSGPEGETGDGAGKPGSKSRERAEDGPAREPNATWPRSVKPLWRDQQIAVARTLPPYNDQTAIHEVEHLYRAAIERAERYIYIENQYFTAQSVTDALARRLQSDKPPEVVLVLPRNTGGWLEQLTMDGLRAHRLRQLRQADHKHRLGVLYPHQDGLGDEECIIVHSKLMISDDCFLRIGSANTSNRSMGLDSECDLALLDEHRDAVAGVLDRLLAEHLGSSVDQVSRARRESGLLAAIEQLRQEQGRSLRELDLDQVSPELDIVPEGDLVDPSEPIDGEYLIRRALPQEDQSSGRARLIGFLALLVAMIALAASWRFTPLGDWLTTDRVSQWLSMFDEPWIKFVTLFGVIVVTTLAMMPLSVLVVAAALLLGPWQGFACSMLGALVSGAIGFLVGQALGGQILERYDESQIHRLSKRLSERGILAVVVLRLLPVAPYTAVNLVAGASHVDLWRFLVGSAIGILPGILSLSLFSGSLLKALQEPSLQSMGVLAVVLALIAVGAWLLRRMLRD